MTLGIYLGKQVSLFINDEKIPRKVPKFCTLFPLETASVDWKEGEGDDVSRDERSLERVVKRVSTCLRDSSGELVGLFG